MATKCPPTEWQESPIKHRWLVIRMIAFLSDTLVQFLRYDIYKTDCYYGLELWDDIGCKLYKMLQRNTFVLSNCMVYFNITNPLPIIGGVYNMTEVNPNPTYLKFKYTKGYVGVRVTNVSNYRKIIEISGRNEQHLQFLVQDLTPKWAL